MAGLSKKVVKDTCLLMGKWIVRFSADFYAKAFEWKHNIEMLLIPKKIGKLVLSNASRAAVHGLVSFGDTFISMFDDSYLSTWKIKWSNKLSNASEKDRDALTREMAHELHALVTEHKFHVGLQSWIDFIQFFIPIPFLELVMH
jgi:hypothetical protein